MKWVMVAVLLGSTPALADWGTVTSAEVCADLSKWSGPECQGEIQKRIKVCLTDGDMAMDLAQLGYTGGDDVPPEVTKLCKKEATKEIQKQLATVSRDKVEHDKRVKEEAEALKTREVPAPGMKDAKLEKMVADAFQKGYGDTKAKVLKIVLDRWVDEDLEKDSLGRVTGHDLSATVVKKLPDGKCYLHYELWLQHGDGRSYSGPLTPRGGGSWVDTEILCSKVK
jgi:hypothetical protein